MLVVEHTHCRVLGELFRVVRRAFARQRHHVPNDTHNQIPHASVQARFDPLLNDGFQRLLRRSGLRRRLVTNAAHIQ